MTNWAVIPAAGVGRRMGASIPKQYLPLLGRPVIEWSIAVLLDHPKVDTVVVALGEEDSLWPHTCYAKDPRVHRVSGGAERADSVLNALSWLETVARADDWVLVHDAARPCLRKEEIDLLIDQSGQAVGAVLGMPVRDTMKRTGEAGLITGTVPREQLWHAFTPQMFSLGILRQTLSDVLAAGIRITDEASAMEWAGHQPLMVEGYPDNIKITRPGDLQLAEFYLQRRRADHFP